MPVPKSHLYSITKTYYRHAHRYLTAKQVESIFRGCENAYKMGTPLNRFFTIHYNDHADPKHPQAFIIGLLERSRKWLKIRGLPVAYLYVIENGQDKGIHVHFLIHIPPHYMSDYKKALKNWLPFEWTKTRVAAKTVSYPKYGQISPLDGVYGLLRYMTKGINPKTPIRGVKAEYQGEVFGRRWGMSKRLTLTQ